MNNSHFFNPKNLEQYTHEPGVYLMKNNHNEVIYVGKANNLKQRIKNYFSHQGDGRAMIPYLIKQLHSIDIIVTLNEKEALLLENTLIKQYQPKFNALLKDDKDFISLMINPKKKWPQVKLVRPKGKFEKGGVYFGPYTNTHAARQVYELMAPIFLLRQCSDRELARRTRPCLLYEMKRCMAPCVKKCTHEEYSLRVEKALDFLRGNDKKIIQELYDEMKKASDHLAFEKAGSLLSMIRQIEQIVQEKNIVVKKGGKNCDALALHREKGRVLLVQLSFQKGSLVSSKHYFFSDTVANDEELYRSFLMQYYHQNQTIKPQEILLPITLSEEQTIEEILNIKVISPQKGSKKRILFMAEKNAKVLFQKHREEEEFQEQLLFELQKIFKLTRFPEKILCFDVSHTSGTKMVAAITCFVHGKYESQGSRLLKIENISSRDDYTALYQAITSYLLPLIEKGESLPDLLLIDGGKGQLNAGIKALKSLDIITIDLISISKERGKHQKSLTQEKCFSLHSPEPILLPLQSPLLFLLQRIRDETHKRAIYFHRKYRQQSSLSSLLDLASGIGPVKKRRLFAHFQTIEKISNASDTELLQIPGITLANIEQIRKVFA